MNQKFVVHLANGKPFDLLEPDPSVFDIETIAFQLSKEQRFSNTIPDLYSVAQHSINVSFCLETPRLRCLGLLHDAAECVLRDIPSPVKRFIDQNSRGFLTRLEWHILTAIFEGLGIGEVSREEWKPILIADNRLARLEAERFGLPVSFPEKPDTFQTVQDLCFDPWESDCAAFWLARCFRANFSQIGTD